MKALVGFDMKIILGKVIAIGIYNSALVVKNRSITKNRRTTMFEIELPIERGGISYIDSESAEISDNMIICAKPGQIRHTKLPFKCYYIHVIIDGELSDALNELPNFIKTDNYQKYHKIFENLCKYYDTKLETDEIMLQSLILELIYMLIRDSEKLSLLCGERRGSDGKVINDAIKYIKKNLTSELSLNTVAAHYGFSPIYFHSLFKSATGKTLRDYVESERIKKAANMIISTDFTLTKIAYECGFSSQSYFSYAFKRRMRLTPREYARSVFERYEAEPDGK